FASHLLQNLRFAVGTKNFRNDDVAVRFREQLQSASPDFIDRARGYKYVPGHAAASLGVKPRVMQVRPQGGCELPEAARKQASGSAGFSTHNSFERKGAADLEV